jgi:hypothetical protein
MAAKQSMARRLFAYLASEAAWQAFWTYGPPPILLGLTAVFGVTEHQPLMWVLMATTTVFAMTSLGLLAFNQWRINRSPQHKVAYQRTVVSRDEKDGHDSAIIGLIFRSFAAFPLEGTLTKFSCSLEDRVQKVPISLPRTIPVDTGNEFFFTSEKINLDGITSELMNGILDYEIEYGRPGGRRFTLSNRMVLRVPLDKTKPFVASQRLGDRDQPGG